MRYYRRRAFSSSSARTYKSQYNTYATFCRRHRYTPVPATSLVLSRYAVYLARTLKPTSISAYMNVVRILHLELEHPNPLDDWYLSTVLRGIKNSNSVPPKQMLPITPGILRQMYENISLASNLMKAFWAASLVAFFSFYRKATLLPMSRVHDCRTQLCRMDFTIQSHCALIEVKQTKTLRGRQRRLVVPVPKITNNILCPVNAVVKLLAAGPSIPSHAALFSYTLDKGALHNLNSETFVKILRNVLTRCGLPASRYSGHSYRRGGASFAASCGVPIELIKAQGDWRSNAVEHYLPSALHRRQQLIHTISNNI